MGLVRGLSAVSQPTVVQKQPAQVQCRRKIKLRESLRLRPAIVADHMHAVKFVGWLAEILAFKMQGLSHETTQATVKISTWLGEFLTQKQKYGCALLVVDLQQDL